eukprot:TRINITY_DN4533_c0_g3_i1.p1 TRINITY_DN4533_c0_g3~~TRINITY_DN4533_c0_g3_i1.p1  ORF type:complete len:276 (-),score=32.94 TRINITY_DN4533_c0_g3_i1:121-903(-)
MASFADYAHGLCLGRSMATVLVMVCLLNAHLLAARRSIDRHSSESSSPSPCGPNSFDAGRSCKCHPGFRCAVGGWPNRCLTRGSFFNNWGRIITNTEYEQDLCLDHYLTRCECIAASERPRDVETLGGTSGAAPAALEAATPDNNNVIAPSLRPIEVDEDFVKAQLSSLPSSLRDEIMSSITCPISLSLTRDPVVAADGNTYDRESIMRAFSTKAAGQPIRGISGDIYSRTVVENLNVRRILAEFERLGNAEKERKDDAQ